MIDAACRSKAVFACRLAGEPAEIHAGSDDDFVLWHVDFVDGVDAAHVDDDLARELPVGSRIDAGDKECTLAVLCEQLHQIRD